MKRLGVKPTAVYSPKVPVVRIDQFRIRRRFLDYGRLAIGRAEDDELVQVLERTARGPEIAGEPIEKLGMGRHGAHVAEVVWRIDDAFAEMIMPDAIHDAAPRQNVVR